MFSTIEQFRQAWQMTSEGTKKMLAALDDASLGHKVGEGHRNLGRMAWHLVQTVAEMSGRVGLKLSGPKHDDPAPATAAEIGRGYGQVADSLLEQVTKEWSDETLKVEDDMYGEMWRRGATLGVLIQHEVHHRGQMTVLMRQAGLKVPGLFGPAKEEWTSYGMEEPPV